MKLGSKKQHRLELFYQSQQKINEINQKVSEKFHLDFGFFNSNHQIIDWIHHTLFNPLNGHLRKFLRRLNISQDEINDPSFALKFISNLKEQTTRLFETINQKHPIYSHPKIVVNNKLDWMFDYQSLHKDDLINLMQNDCEKLKNDDLEVYSFTSTFWHNFLYAKQHKHIKIIYDTPLEQLFRYSNQGWLQVYYTFLQGYFLFDEKNRSIVLKDELDVLLKKDLELDENVNMREILNLSSLYLEYINQNKHINLEKNEHFSDVLHQKTTKINPHYLVENMVQRFKSYYLSLDELKKREWEPLLEFWKLHFVDSLLFDEKQKNYIKEKLDKFETKVIKNARN